MGAQSGPDAKCCGQYDGIPGPVAGPATAFTEASWNIGCPVDSITQDAIDLYHAWTVSGGSVVDLFGCSLYEADNRTAEGIRILDDEARRIRQANKAS